MTIHPQPSYPSEARSVPLEGVLRVEGIARAMEQIAALMHSGSDPILLKINSTGGRIELLDHLGEWLARPVGPGTRPPVVAVARDQARSTAALVLVMADRAYAHRHTQLLFHGVAYGELRRHRNIRQEQALVIAQRLEAKNRKIAQGLARRVVYRLAARFHEFSHAKPAPVRRGSESRNALLFLVNALQRRLHSDGLKKLVCQTGQQLAIMLSLDRSLWGHLSRSPPSPSQEADWQVALLQALAGQEGVSRKAGQKSLDDRVAMNLLTHYLMFRGLRLDLSHPEMLKLVAVLAPENAGERAAGISGRAFPNKDRRATPPTGLIELALPWWSFAEMLCWRLMVGEHVMDAADCYWLGLIDELIDAQPGG